MSPQDWCPSTKYVHTSWMNKQNGPFNRHPMQPCKNKWNHP